MSTILHRDGNRVWLEGIETQLLFEKCSSVHAAQTIIAQAAGENISYDFQVGVSSLAFRMQIHDERLCPSSPHSFCGFQCVSRSARALPWNLQIYQVARDDEGSKRDVRQEIVESINRGLPVQYGNEEDGILFGYQDDGEAWICLNPFHTKGKEAYIETQWPWGIVIFAERKQTLPSKFELAINALRQAVVMATTKRKQNYFVGWKAWKEYIERLQQLSEREHTIESTDILGNAWIYHCLIQHRECASYYLRDIAELFPATSTKRLERAADLFEQMSAQVLTDSTHTAAEIAPFPQSLQNGQTWSNELRHDQILRLQRARDLEIEAIAEIERAIAGLADDQQVDFT